MNKTRHIIILMFVMIYTGVCGQTVRKNTTTTKHTVTHTTTTNRLSSTVSLQSLAATQPFIFQQIKMRVTAKSFKETLIRQGYEFDCGNLKDDYPFLTFNLKRGEHNITLMVHSTYQGKYVYRIYYTENGFKSKSEANMRIKTLTNQARNDNGIKMGKCPHNDNIWVWKNGEFSATITEGLVGEYGILLSYLDTYSFLLVNQEAKTHKGNKKHYDPIDVVAWGEEIMDINDKDRVQSFLEKNGFHYQWADENNAKFQMKTESCDFVDCKVYPFDKKIPNSNIRATMFTLNKVYVQDFPSLLKKHGYVAVPGKDDEWQKGNRRLRKGSALCFFEGENDGMIVEEGSIDYLFYFLSQEKPQPKEQEKTETPIPDRRPVPPTPGGVVEDGVAWNPTLIQLCDYVLRNNDTEKIQSELTKIGGFRLSKELFGSGMEGFNGKYSNCDIYVKSKSKKSKELKILKVTIRKRSVSNIQEELEKLGYKTAPRKKTDLESFHYYYYEQGSKKVELEEVTSHEYEVVHCTFTIEEERK